MSSRLALLALALLATLRPGLAQEQNGPKGLVGNTFKSTSLTVYVDPSGRFAKLGEIRRGKWVIEGDHLCASDEDGGRRQCVHVQVEGTRVSLTRVVAGERPGRPNVGELLPGNPLGL